MVADNSGSGATTSTRIEDSGRNPHNIPGQKLASGKSNIYGTPNLETLSPMCLRQSWQSTRSHSH